MTKPQNIAAIEKATNKAWDEWVSWLDDKNGRDLTHPEIVKLAYAELEGAIDKPGWWAQGVTVAYEQHIGRRIPGQRADGSFEVSISKTYDGEREEVFEKCLNLLADVTHFNEKAVENARTSITPVRSYWRCDVDGGSKLTWSVEQKAPGKVLVTVAHASLLTPEDAAEWRDFWKTYLERV